MIRNLLVPFDDSRPSTLALEYALREYLDEQLTAVYVLNLRQYHLYDEGYAYGPELLNRLKRGAKRYSRAPIRSPANTTSKSNGAGEGHPGGGD